MPSEKKPNTGGETGYANNKVQWFFEDQGFDVSSLADEMYEEMNKRGWSPDSVDWKVVEQGLARFLAAQAPAIVERLRKNLNNDEG